MNERMLALYSLVNGKNEKVSKIKLKKKKSVCWGQGYRDKKNERGKPKEIAKETPAQNTGQDGGEKRFCVCLFVFNTSWTPCHSV